MLFGRSESAEEVEHQIEALRQLVQEQAATIRDLQSQLDMQAEAAESVYHPDFEVNAEEAAMARAGDPVGAIKAYRMRTGRTLTESKAAIDTIK
ncbi:hypothetical protein [Boudabousia marimammalium]|uniref:50S ribosomal protein L7/L12 n=1 Tax=Boudabousia marimammalium TaxID=156892 RepID=A0A1Q5PSY1_9ACTO|nr:hypothetical protein [Boudabousia marimammalium]OKL50653.1 hypothetical protein BM477_01520 [Boudabousia marimammalium]